jgi:hypothetical protein
MSQIFSKEAQLLVNDEFLTPTEADQLYDQCKSLQLTPDPKCLIFATGSNASLYRLFLRRSYRLSLFPTDDASPTLPRLSAHVNGSNQPGLRDQV